MKPHVWILAGLTAAGLCGVSAVGQDSTPPAPVPPLKTDRKPDPAPSNAKDLAALRAAADPSSAVELYVRASAAAPHDAAIESVYVRRMVDFGLPEMAESQARDLATRDPHEGLARGVVAYMSAKRGDTSDALSQIVAAQSLAPDDPFVLRTAGQVMAWFDVRADRSKLSAELQASAEKMRLAAGARGAYSDAYRRARESYVSQDSGGAHLIETVPPEEPAQPPAESTVIAPSETIIAPPETTYVENTTYVYTDPYAYSYVPQTTVVYEPWLPTPCWNTSCNWWPTFGSVLIVGDHDRFRRHDGRRSDFGFHRDDHERDFRSRQRFDRGSGFNRGFTSTPHHDRGVSFPRTRSDFGGTRPYVPRSRTTAPWQQSSPTRPRWSTTAPRTRSWTPSSSPQIRQWSPSRATPSRGWTTAPTAPRAPQSHHWNRSR